MSEGSRENCLSDSGSTALLSKKAIIDAAKAAYVTSVAGVTVENGLVWD